MSNRVVLGITLTLLLVSMFSLALNIQPVRAQGTIYIRADGSIDPPDASISTLDNATYTLTGNIASVADGIVVERDDIVLDGAGYTVQGTGAYDSIGISLDERSNVTIKNASIRNFLKGIYIFGSANTISGNNITVNPGDSIYVEGGSDNTVSGNNMTNNGCGLRLSYFGVHFVRICSIFGNNIADNVEGIHFYRSFNNIISENNVAENSLYGIYFESSLNNSINGNDIANNNCGIGLGYDSSNNTFCHNNFISNTAQMSDYAQLANFWDNGYEGNYWSDYNGTDANHDGIGGTPYVIDANNTDHYPIMVQYAIPEFPSFLIPPLFVIFTFFAVAAKRKATRRCS